MQAVSHGHSDSRVKPNLTVYDKLLCKKKESIKSVWWSATYGREMGKCGVLIPSHFHQAILIPIPMKLAQWFQFSWEPHGTMGIPNIDSSLLRARLSECPASSYFLLSGRLSVCLFHGPCCLNHINVVLCSVNIFEANLMQTYQCSIVRRTLF